MASMGAISSGWVLASGTYSLNSGSMRMGPAYAPRTSNGNMAAQAHSHQRLGLRRITAYRPHARTVPMATAIACSLVQSQSQDGHGCLEIPKSREIRWPIRSGAISAIAAYVRTKTGHRRRRGGKRNRTYRTRAAYTTPAK